jgi:glycosyltransferase involved in cell wall biosynthesis
MKIAVNTRLLLPDRLDGWGRFTLEVLRPMVEQHPEHEFIFLFDRKYDPQFVLGPNVTPVVVHPQARHPWLWHIWFEWMLPRVLNRVGADLFLSPDGYLSMGTDVPSLSVIHDLNFLHNPEDLKPGHSRYFNANFPRFAEKAARIATVSEFSKQDIVSNYGIDPSKVDVVYNGVSERFQPIAPFKRMATMVKWSDGAPYFIFVGAMHPRKNIVRMLKAFDRFRAECDSPLKLLLVGTRQWWTTDMETTLAGMRHRQDVIFTGRVSEHDLQQLMGAAFASLYVSTFEGFGIPIIEAFQAGVPVITSNVTSMPEVAGDAALLVDPMSEEAIASAMQRVWDDATLREDLIVKGKLQASKFTWQRTSDLLWQSMMRIPLRKAPDRP